MPPRTEQDLGCENKKDKVIEKNRIDAPGHHSSSWRQNSTWLEANISAHQKADKNSYERKMLPIKLPQVPILETTPEEIGKKIVVRILNSRKLEEISSKQRNDVLMKKCYDNSGKGITKQIMPHQTRDSDPLQLAFSKLRVFHWKKHRAVGALKRLRSIV